MDARFETRSRINLMVSFANMMPTSPWNTRRSQSLCSFDIARIIAIFLVVMQHLLTIFDYRPPVILGCLNPGQLGVTIFCVLSGYFSMRSHNKNLTTWLAHRLGRIYPPYWISLSAIFLANMLIGYKPVTLGLVASEYLGTALFTHSGVMVGVHIWFISLILLCYGIAAVLRWQRTVLPLAIVVTIAALFRWPLISAHVLSFLVGCSLSNFGTLKQAWKTELVIVIIGTLGIVFLDTHFAYPLAALGVLLLCSASTSPSPGILILLSELTYEFFLVHGPIYLGLAKYAHLSFISDLFWGTLLAICATMILSVASSLFLACAYHFWHSFFCKTINIHAE
jgi:peptidoglycan/LPS O-acetylase OafA/YrhL